MSDFGGGDWDLRAVVRGCNISMEDDPHTCVSPLMSYQYYLQEEQQIDMITTLQEDDLIFGNVVFPEYLFADISTNNSNSDFDLLEDLYKPFYPPHLSTNSSENLVSDSAEQNLDHVGTDHDQCSKPVGAKYRRRKNQHMRVVMEVTAEGLSSDMWAWRKYGQKPIKGSPYPRSYYRCSSSRGCPARKQVERSHSDIPTANFIITYTAEHNHSKPTRRNSLAGTTRQRFSNSNLSTVAGVSAENNTTTSEDMKKKKKKKTDVADDQVKFMINQDVIINSHDDHMMIMSDDFLAAADFEDAQLNALTSSSDQLQFHQADYTTSTNFW